MQTVRDASSILGLGRSPGGGHGNSSILAWRILWTEEPGGRQSIGSQRIGRDWSDLALAQRSKDREYFSEPGESYRSPVPRDRGTCRTWGHVEKCLLSSHCRSCQCLRGLNPAGTQKTSEPRDAVVKSLPVGWRRDENRSGDANTECLAHEIFKSSNLQVWLILLFLWGHTHTLRTYTCLGHFQHIQPCP